MFRFAVLFAAALLMAGPAQANEHDDLLLKGLKYFKACPNCALSGADLSGLDRKCDQPKCQRCPLVQFEVLHSFENSSNCFRVGSRT